MILLSIYIYFFFSYTEEKQQNEKVKYTILMYSVIKLVYQRTIDAKDVTYQGKPNVTTVLF